MDGRRAKAERAGLMRGREDLLGRMADGFGAVDRARTQRQDTEEHSTKRWTLPDLPTDEYTMKDTSGVARKFALGTRINCDSLFEILVFAES